MIIELFVLEFQLKRLEISLEEEFSHTKKSESWISCAKSTKLFRLGSEGKYLYVRELKFPTRTTWTEFNDFFTARFFCRGKVSFTPKSEYLHGKISLQWYRSCTSLDWSLTHTFHSLVIHTWTCSVAVACEHKSRVRRKIFCGWSFKNWMKVRWRSEVRRRRWPSW